MEIFKKFWRRLFPEKPTHTAEEIKTLRLEFKTRYQNFRHLIQANSRTLEAMAEIEQALQGERPFGMTFVRSKCTTVSVSVYQMIRKLQVLAPDKYRSLFSRFDQIQARIDQVLDVRSALPDRRMVIPLTDIDKDMIDLVGSKMANLGEIKNKVRLKVPAGFAITAYAYHRFIEYNDLRSEINRLMQSVDSNDIEAMYRLNAKLNQMIVKAELPHDLETTIMAAWQRIEEDAGGKITAAVRSSALGEDVKGSSFAGMHLSVLNVSREHVLESYKEIVASKYSLPAMNYRQLKGFRDEDIALCVGCLEMVDALSGGVTYTRNPIDISNDAVFINAVWGLPKAVVDGTVNSDLFVVSRQQPMKIIYEKIEDKKNKFVCYPQEGVCRIDLTGDSRNLPSISTEQALALVTIAVKIENYYGGPQDIEWAIGHDGALYILQCRPLQPSETDPAVEIVDAEADTASAELIAGGGITASPGVASGRVYRVDSDLDLLQFPKDAILLTHSALPRWASLLNRAAAVITEQGSFAGHLANVAREFNVPALFGVPNIMTALNNGDLITVEARARKIFRGRVATLLKQKRASRSVMEGSPVFETLKAASRHIIPLTLLDPDAPEFRPANCQTLQDITRFIHEKSVHEMFSFGKEHTFSERAGKQLFYHVPMHWWVLNLDDGFKEEVPGKYVKLENIASIPMLAFWEGFTAIPWEGPPAIDRKGLISVMFRSTSDTALVVGRRSAYADQNYFMISKKFCNLSSRLGYHFSTLEAYVTERAADNYIKFQFKGGAADYARRLQRVLFIKELLENFDFRVKITEDNLVSRIDGRESDYMIQRLLILGYLSIHTRQIDMIMTNQAAVKHYRAKYEKDIDFLIHRHQLQFFR
jgi:pyruvate,water dikinase